MSEAKRFFKSGILLTLVGLAMRTVAMFFSAFITRTVGAEGTGIYTLIMTVYSFALTLATSGLSLTVTRLVAFAVGEGRADRVGSLLRGAFLYAFIFGLIASLGLFFGAGLLGREVLSDERTVSSLRVLALSLIPAALSSALSGYFVGVKRVGFNAAANVLCQFIRIALTVILVIHLSARGIVAAVIGLCIGITLTEILGFCLIFFEFLYDWRKNGQKTTNKTPAISDVATTALPLGFSAYVRSLLLNVEHILIPKKLRESGESQSEAYAHYGSLHGMALPVITYPMSPLSSFAGLLVPEFAEDMSAGRSGRMSRIASKATNSTLTYAIICAVFLYIFSEELGYLVYNSYDAGYYISALAFVVPIMYLDHVTDSMLKGIGEQVFSMWVNIADSFLSVVLVWLLIPRMGIMGYAVVIVLMEGFNFLLSFKRLKQKIRFDIRPIKAIILPLLASISGAYLASELFKFSGSSSAVLWLVFKMIFALSIAVLILSLADLASGFLTRKSSSQKNKAAV